MTNRKAFDDIASNSDLYMCEKQYLLRQPSKRRTRLYTALKRAIGKRNADTTVGAPLRLRILNSALPRETKMNLFRDTGKSPDEKQRAFLESLLSVPFGKRVDTPTDFDSRALLVRASEIMEECIVGHDEMKSTTLSMYNQWLHGGRTCFAIGLEGPPGVGKTTFVREALTRVLDRPIAFINLGGANDASYLCGHSYTYEGARHGRLVGSLIESGVMNPILFFDELDKVSDTPRGDEIVNTLVHLTDPAQNRNIRDRFFHGIDIDFSECVLVFSYNDRSKINPVLLDRLQTIRVPLPTAEEKLRVMQTRMIPRALEKTGSIELKLERSAIDAILQLHARDVGMRGIEKTTERVVACAALCASYGSMAIVGGRDEPLGDVDARFVAHVASRHELAAREAETSPPAHMYV